MTLQKFGVWMSCCSCSLAEYCSSVDEHSNEDISAAAYARSALCFYCRRRHFSSSYAVHTRQQHVDSSYLALQLLSDGAYAGLIEISNFVGPSYGVPSQRRPHQIIYSSLW